MAVAIVELAVAAVKETRRVKTLVVRGLVVRRLLRLRQQENQPLLKLRGLVTVEPVITLQRLRLAPVKTVALAAVDAALAVVCE
jgi:hypothetical protein